MLTSDACSALIFFGNSGLVQPLAIVSLENVDPVRRTKEVSVLTFEHSETQSLLSRLGFCWSPVGLEDFPGSSECQGVLREAGDEECAGVCKYEKPATTVAEMAQGEYSTLHIATIAFAMSGVVAGILTVGVVAWYRRRTCLSADEKLTSIPRVLSL